MRTRTFQFTDDDVWYAGSKTIDADAFKSSLESYRLEMEAHYERPCFAVEWDGLPEDGNDPRTGARFLDPPPPPTAKDDFRTALDSANTAPQIAAAIKAWLDA